jgi:hypothetical protein
MGAPTQELALSAPLLSKFAGCVDEHEIDGEVRVLAHIFAHAKACPHVLGTHAPHAREIPGARARGACTLVDMQQGVHDLALATF